MRTEEDSWFRVVVRNWRQYLRQSNGRQLLHCLRQRDCLKGRRNESLLHFIFELTADFLPVLHAPHLAEGSQDLGIQEGLQILKLGLLQRQAVGQRSHAFCCRFFEVGAARLGQGEGQLADGQEQLQQADWRWEGQEVGGEEGDGLRFHNVLDDR